MGIDTTHIPLAYREKPPLGYYSYPVVAQTIAKATGGVYTCSLDQHSDLSHKESFEQDIKWLLGQSIRNSIPPDIGQMLDILDDQNQIIIKKTNIKTCSDSGCGQTEYQVVEDSSMHYVTGSHRQEKSGCCSSCGFELREKEITGLLLRIPEILPIDRIKTGYLHSNIENLHKTFQGSELLISRTTSTCFKWSGFNIDNDTSNYLSMAEHADTSQGDDTIYISGANTGFQIYMMSVLSERIGVEVPHVIALPKITIDTSKSRIDNITTQTLKDASIPADICRLILLSGLQSNVAHMVIPSHEFGGLHRRLHTRAREVIATNASRLSLSDIPLDMPKLPNKQKLQQIIKELTTQASELELSRQDLLAAAIIIATLELPT